MDGTPLDTEPDNLDNLDEALEQLESVDPADAPSIAHNISNLLARVLDSTEAP